jgi:hypothetical protein
MEPLKNMNKLDRLNIWWYHRTSHVKKAVVTFMVSCFRTGLTCWQPTHRVVLRRAGSKKTSYCTLQKLTQTGKTNG